MTLFMARELLCYLSDRHGLSPVGPRGPVVILYICKPLLGTGYLLHGLSPKGPNGTVGLCSYLFTSGSSLRSSRVLLPS